MAKRLMKASVELVSVNISSELLPLQILACVGFVPFAVGEVVDWQQAYEVHSTCHCILSFDMDVFTIHAFECP